MNIQRFIRNATLACTVLVAGHAIAGTTPPLSGAVYTTVSDGSIVNANVQYTSKCAVFLDGGPGPNAPVGAGALPPGDYYFQVTDPSGKKLLSTDVVANRRITVNANGVISAWIGNGGPLHNTGVDKDHAAQGAITVELANVTCPTDYLDTPNNGGVYKVWVTPVGDGTIAGNGFVGDPYKVDNGYAAGYYHGFIPARSKTDNFKVKAKQATFCLTVEKQVMDATNNPVVYPGWPITVTDGTGVTNLYYTTADTPHPLQICSLTADGNPYTVAEVLPADWVNVGLWVNSQPLPISTTYSFKWSPGQPGPVVVFFNESAAQYYAP